MIGFGGVIYLKKDSICILQSIIVKSDCCMCFLHMHDVASSIYRLKSGNFICRLQTKCKSDAYQTPRSHQSGVRNWEKCNSKLTHKHVLRNLIDARNLSYAHKPCLLPLLKCFEKY